MKRESFYFKASLFASLFVFIQALLLPSYLMGQTPDCTYDRDNPSVDSARRNFKITNYACAEIELKDLLARESISIEERADAHVLLASVYYAMLRDDKDKSKKVTKHFVEAFKAFRAWKGDLDIKSPEFLALMDQAREIVDQEADATKLAEEKLEGIETPADTLDAVPVVTGQSEGKPWYKKWWALGLGIGVVAVVVVAMSGGGDDGTTEDQTLPGFPETPTK